MMTRKDYERLARIVKNMGEDIELGAGPSSVPLDPEQHRRNLACRLADMCGADNPRFDRNRFYEAAGI